MKILSAVILAVGLIGCSLEKNVLGPRELKLWSSSNDTLYYRSVPCAVFKGFEMELYKGEMTTELCLEQINDTIVPIDSIVMYVHTRHHDEKVQVISTYEKTKKLINDGKKIK